MKKIFLLLCVLVPVFTNAQEKITAKETFESNRFQWDEFYEKEYSGSVEDGYFVLKNKKDGFNVRTLADLPIDIERNFKITFKILVPKLNDKYYFGIIYDYQNGNNYGSFLVTEKRYKIIEKVNGIISDEPDRTGGIILSSGKDKEVTIEIEKKGNKLIFTVDNMEVLRRTRKLSSSEFGFIVYDANTIKIDEVIIEQITEN